MRAQAADEDGSLLGFVGRGGRLATTPRAASRCSWLETAEGHMPTASARAVLAADRRYVRLSLSPVFTPASGPPQAPVVVNPTIPGGRGP